MLWRKLFMGLQKTQFCTCPSLNLLKRRGLGCLAFLCGCNKWLDLERRLLSYGSRSVHTGLESPRPRINTGGLNFPPGLRISRMERASAQNALFDYFHLTRGMPFTDAEYISKNSPDFLRKLLSKANVDDEQDVGRSITRFLRFHPINEFEPFFESLGLKPNEVRPLLPRDHMFLADDGGLLKNYHVLCNYGVPRSKIGKLYKEFEDIFRYSEEVLSSKLHAYELLRLSRPTIIKLITCCPEFLVGDADVNFLQFVEKLKSIGVEIDWIRGCLSDKSKYNWRRILEMLTFLDMMCSNKKDLVFLINKHPRFLFDDSGRKMYILVAILLKIGLNMDKILGLFLRYPRVLSGNFSRYISNSVNFLGNIGMKVGDIATLVSGHPDIFGSSFCRRPHTVLRKLNISAERLCEIIIDDPCQFNGLVCTRKITFMPLPKVETHFLQEKSSFLLKLGFVENSDEIAKALRIYRGRGDQLQERFDILINGGLDCHTVTEMVKVVPHILNQTTDVIKMKLDYLLKELGYPLEALVVFPAFLCYNMEKIKIRFSMLNWLKEHGVAKPAKNRKVALPTVSLSTVLACSDARFMKYYVDVHPEGPDMWKKLNESLSSN